MASIVVPPRDYRLAPLRGALPEVQLQMMSDQQLRLSLTDENGLASEVSDATTRNSGKVTIQFAEHPERAPGVTLQAFRGQSVRAAFFYPNIHFLSPSAEEHCCHDDRTFARAPAGR